MIDADVGQARQQNVLWIKKQYVAQEILGRDVLDARMPTQAVLVARRKVA